MIHCLKSASVVLAIIAIASGAIYAKEKLKPTDVPEGIVRANGRIEAVEIDIATKIPGQIAEISAEEGDFVSAGQVLAYMDTENLRGHWGQPRNGRNRCSG